MPRSAFSERLPELMSASLSAADKSN
jgi:hypothetical protein